MRIWSQLLGRFLRPRRRSHSHKSLSNLRTEHLEARSLLAADLIAETTATGFDGSHQEMLDAAKAIPMLIENGSIAASPSGGLPTPSNFQGLPVEPIVTDSFDQAISSNEWWSSVHFPAFGDQFSAPLFAHPLTVQMTNTGVSLAAQSFQTAFETGSTTREFVTPFTPDLYIDLFGSQQPNRFALDSYTDWAFTGKWQGVDTSPTTMVAQGSPFIWLSDVQFNDLKIHWDDAATVASVDQNVVYLTIGNDLYGLYAPDGSSWSVNGQSATVAPNGTGNLTIALLPNLDASTRDTFKSAADNPVVETHFSFASANDPYSIKLTYDYTLERNDASADTIVALYPHLARHISNPNSISTNAYKSPRGEMQPVQTNRVEAEIKARGILPILPTTLTPEQTATLSELLVNDSVAHDPLAYVSQFADPYWSGKAMLKLMQLSQIAELVGETEIQTGIQMAVKQTFNDWFNFNGNTSDRHFAYNAEWDTLQAYPESFGSGQSLNDHHFHMGYFVHAAALLGMSDPAWISDNQTMVDLIIQDVAQIDPDSNELPKLRNFSPMAGHSWAAGHGAFSRGNNQESSSEAMNFATGLMLWGEATQRPQTTMLGQTLYSLEAEAISEYWFDKYGRPIQTYSTWNRSAWCGVTEPPTQRGSQPKSK